MHAPLPHLVEQEVDLVGRVFLSRRPFIVGPLAAWTLAVLAAAPGTPGLQLRVLALGLGVGFTLFVTEAVLVRRRAVTGRWLFGSLLATVLAVSAAAVVLGGLGGPFLPMLFAPAGVGFAAFGLGGRGLALWGVTTVVLVGMLLGAPFPPLPLEVHRLVAVGAASASVLLLLLGVGALRGAHLGAGQRALAASDEVVAAARARVRSVEELAGHFGHELKNPLAALRGLVEVMREGEVDERTRRRLAVAAEEVARMQRVLEQGLDFTRPLGAARREPVQVDGVVRAVCEVLGAQATRSGRRLRWEGEPLTAALDGPRVKEALVNLLLNALEASPPGGEVVVRWRRADARLDLEVSDEGPGLDDATLARIGQPFFTTRERGTGLGAAMSRQVAAQHGGALRYRRGERCGTIATLELGLEEPPREEER